MSSRPEAIDSRLVLHIYSAAVLPLGIVSYMWPLVLPETFPSQDAIVKVRVGAAVVTALGTCAAALAKIDDPVGRRRALMGFAHAHVMLGAMLLIQALTAWQSTMGTLAAWTALIVGLVLLYLAITGPGSDFTPSLPPLATDPQGRSRSFVVRNKPSLGRLRSEYEEQIRQAARQEERARLARDLHDAVKQQLFAIQTAGATAQARFESDRPGALDAIAQVRSAAREAMAEMEAMLDQLQAVPIENAGLVEFVRRQCDALGFRTGAVVQFETGLLPDNLALDPSARQALARVAQEALSNVARHARAHHVHVTLGLAEGRFALTVKDDGSGFEPDKNRRGMGIANIAARAAEVGGTFEVVSAQGGGTTVRFSVPCNETRSPRPYVNRAAVWFVVLIVILALTDSRGANADPWAIPIALIAAIAVTRYTVAAYWLLRRRETI